MTTIIADFCSNHLGNRKIMEQGIRLAAEAGVDYIKFQSFEADKLNKNWPDFENSYQYYKSLELSECDHAFIISKCKEYGIRPLFTAFTLGQAKMLHSFGLPVVKIASPDAENESLIQYCTENFGNVIISCGMVSERRAHELLKYHTALYCVSRYPCPKEDIDYEKMALFDGFSDHTIGITAAKKAVDMGMGYVERHYTLGKYLPGNDHKFSSTPDEFKELIDYRNYKAKINLYKERWNG